MEDLELAKQGDYEALERIINQIKYKLYKTGMAILKNDDDVCDALQETLISIYKNIGKLEKREYFSTWAIRILINKCNIDVYTLYLLWFIANKTLPITA